MRERALAVVLVTLIFSATATQSSASDASGGLGVESTRLGPVPRMMVGVAVSPDGRHVVMLTTQNGKYWAVVDGQPGPKFAELIKESVVFSPGSKRVAYAAANGPKKWLVVVDGQPGAEVDLISDRGAVFSADSKRVVYAAVKGESEFVVIDGQPGPEFDKIGEIRAFSPDSKRLAYSAKKGRRTQLGLRP